MDLAVEPQAVPTGRNLVTIEDARLYVLRDPEDASYDQLWELLIPSVSESCCFWVDRQFWPEDDATHTFDAVGWAGRIVLSPWELRAATAVSLDGAETSDYTLLPIGRTTQGTFWSLELGGSGDVLEVEGDWGMAEVPPTARHACLLALEAYYQNSAGHASESLGGHSYSEVVETFPMDGLPRSSRGMLEAFRRISVT